MEVTFDTFDQLRENKMSYGFTPERHAEIDGELKRISTYLTALAVEVNTVAPVVRDESLPHLTLTLAAEQAARARFHISVLQEFVPEAYR
jgi:hypothetical protein